MKFVATERAKQGTGASRRLRNSGNTPGIVYGGGAEPLAIETNHNELWHALKKEAFHSSVLEMDIAGQTSKVVLRDVQFHPYKQLVLHVDFQRVDEKTKLHLNVPLHFEGADKSPAVAQDKCVVTPLVTALPVICVPSDLPEFITVDLSNLQKGSSFTLKNVKLPKGVEAHIRGTQSNPALVSIVPPADEIAAPAEGAAPAAPAKKGKK
ncbi:50S ribosomal protein L25/general stress protein Ctc [Comamonas endophytica]|uniref:Large ribosomal subunit protein bL25 n=1 Tax=Comamonas endophytica TaxID=2949090 RepID=A0ABY6GC11_9BURK|nr:MULTISPECIES: 50S ribosomal protein L25/general stress protein Ctc [unclassified Acidovorax]MCD2513056.1 50S ribosomal protein L25/general stress protein Ctc [Acidovorax sp. D4N7]UYG52604.1 50S ribosomal protein L25/general stress protein Ctc [Acidovorax sp. 5MLIR]